MPVSRSPLAIIVTVLCSLILGLSCGLSPAAAGGSIPLDEVMEQLKDDDKLIAALNAELEAQGLKAEEVICSGSRFGNHWENLGGARAIPYECLLGPRTIEIDGELHLFDKDGNELSLDDDDAPQKVVDYKQTNLKWSWK